MKNVIVIGAGPAGLTAAINASKKNNVTIIDQNNKIGKKLLITGNGKCNYWNKNQDIENYNSSSDLSDLITSENLSRAFEFTKEIGIIPYIKNDCFYPTTNQSISVVSAFLKKLEECNIDFISEKVINITNEENHFIVKTNLNEYRCDNVIIATGGLSYPKTGSDGSAFSIIENLGHKIIKPLPSLVQLNTIQSIKEIAGVRCNAKISAYINDQIIMEEPGEITFTDKAISGIAAFQVSSKIVRNLYNNQNVRLSIDFSVNICDKKEDFKNIFADYLNKFKKRNISDVLDQLFNYKLANYILHLSKIKRDEKVCNLTEFQTNTIVNNIISCNFDICATGGFDTAQVTSGGVSLDEINHRTLESLVIPGLFFAGEMIDVDGRCGGYNITFAILSGCISGMIGDLNEDCY